MYHHDLSRSEEFSATNLLVLLTLVAGQTVNTAHLEVADVKTSLVDRGV
jgi:hypothetical protein